MMMPANFSAVSENEMTYVMGGSIADYLAPAMGAAQWQNFHKNLVTIVGNKYVQGFLDNTVGVCSAAPGPRRRPDRLRRPVQHHLEEELHR